MLGPKLLVLYINDSCNVSKLAKRIFFVDNTNICRAGDNVLRSELDIVNKFGKNCRKLQQSSTRQVVSFIEMECVYCTVVCFCLPY